MLKLAAPYEWVLQALTPVSGEGLDLFALSVLFHLNLLVNPIVVDDRVFFAFVLV